ncbi:hypothetical protein AN639_01400 [Candidatus Epulonipiscium fishelsonii]|uniref:Uncharacterized protein n=1 Tax=Candidatus Epulonipiscium fishelsonii TaxID=77094 RepID=A0ACC8XC62_9FIRM|nr:hypothetical protein AN639_01400 [Epulopiscium sp. SCG-B05WGA-EpuloA1]ONI40015.1 hypothetical protein AN396_06605 [Epulopiscium sp. SCG-B11WGA-EpuloA1]
MKYEHIIKTDIDFTEDIRFKLLCLHTVQNIDGIDYNPIPVVKDIINVFGSILPRKIKISSDDVVKPKLLPYSTIKKIRAIQHDKNNTIAQIINKTQEILSDYRVYTFKKESTEKKWVNSTTLEMQNKADKYLIFRVGKGLIAGANELAYDSSNHKETGIASAMWLLPRKQVPQFKDDVVVEVVTTAFGVQSRACLKIPEIGHSYLINISHPKLRESTRYTSNTRLQLWLNFLLKGELDLSDEVFKEVYKLCQYLKVNKEVNEVVSLNLDYASLLTRSDREEGLLEGIKKGREEGILEGIERGIERGIEEGIEKGIEKGILKGQILAYLDMNIPLNEIAEKFNISIEEIQKLIY